MTFIKDFGSTVIKDNLKRLMEEGKVLTFIFLSSFVLWLANIIFDISKEIKEFIPNEFILYSDIIFLLIIKYCLTAILISAVLSFGLSIFANIYYNKSNWSKELDQRFITLKRVVSFTLNACFDFSSISFLHGNTLIPLRLSGIITKGTFDMSVELASKFRALAGTELWNVQAVRNSEKWLEVLELSDRIKDTLKCKRERRQ